MIAVIDSGFRPVKQHVSPSRLISPGLNLVPGATEPPAISDLNEPHGTFVSGMAAANIAFCFSTANRFVVVAEFYGGAFVSPPCAATARLVPMIGSAPGASIFPIKVFPAAGGGSPTSRVIAAMEAAIDLRQKFDTGEPGGLNIRVANLSLGGPTNAAARELDDQAVEALINADIVPVVAAGNEGHSSVTTGSPGTSFAALTVGRVDDHRHEQIFRAQFSAPCGCRRRWRGARVRQVVASGHEHADLPTSARAARRTTAASIRTSSRSERSTTARQRRRDDRQFRQRDVLFDADSLRDCRRAAAGGARRDRTPGPPRDHRVR